MNLKRIYELESTYEFTNPPRNFFPGAARSSWFLATAVLVALLGLASPPLARTGQRRHHRQQRSTGQDNHPARHGRHMGGRGCPSVDDQIKHLKKKLNLSADQQAKLKPILEDHANRWRRSTTTRLLPARTASARCRRFGKALTLEIKSVLTEDQQKSFDKLREEQKGRMGKWRKGGDNAPPAGDSQ